jgi:phenylacetate-coenzyme A ligase PaaK-like adenylate-forming protein
MVLSPLDAWLTRRIGQLEATAPPSSDTLRQWQLGSLKDIVAYAQDNSPFYSHHLANIDGSSIHSLEDFSRLPMLMPAQLHSAPGQLLCVSQDEIARVVTLTSSGTTGPPKRIFYTADDLEATVDYFGWGMSSLVGPGETALVLMPGDRPDGVGRLLMDALARTGARAVPHGVMEDGDVALEQCLSENAQCLVGAASHINCLARAWEQRGLGHGIIRSVLLCWDAVPDAVVNNCERIFGCRVFRHWGMIETGLGGAVDCTPGSGMHLRETDVFVEIVDLESGRLLPDGQFGEMVVTTPLKLGMPLIRYRTGDMGRILPGQCECGSPLRRLDYRVCRIGDGVKIGAERLRMEDLNEVLYGMSDVSDFSANLVNDRLHVVVTGLDNIEPGKVRFALESIAPVAHALKEKSLDITIDIRRGLFPAKPGLGKRRIRTHMENES